MVSLDTFVTTDNLPGWLAVLILLVQGAFQLGKLIGQILAKSRSN